MRKVVALFVIIIVIMTVNNTYATTNNELQQLIDQTPEFGVIELGDQTYHGNIIITKPLTIIGQDHTIIRGDNTGNVIDIFSEYVALENVIVENSGKDRSSSEEFAAIKVHKDNNRFKNIIIRDSFHGIYIIQAHNNELANIHITGTSDGTIGGQGNGVNVYYSHNNRLDNVIVTGTRDGLFFDFADGNEVVNSEFTNSRYGLHFMYSNDNTFYNNKFNYNTGGAAIMESARNTLMNNEFSFNQSTRSFGVLLQNANENIIKENQFFQNQRALFIEQANRNRIEKNDIYHNLIAIEIWASAKDQVITENRFFKNTTEVITAGGMPNNNWSENGRGNYWGTAIPLIDLNQDGVGDYPVEYTSSLYQLIEQNELAYLFLNSPTITIYEKINELINRQQIMFIDEYPLIDTEREPRSSAIYAPAFLLLVSWLWYRRRRQQ